MALDGIFLDMYGTVTTGDRECVEGVCRQIIEDTGVDLPAHELAVIWGERFFHAMDFCNDGSFRTLYQVEVATLRETMAQLGVDVDADHYCRQLTAYWQKPPLWPEVPEFLATFPLPICIVSNADRADIDAVIRVHALKIAYVVTSEDVRSYKPAPTIFRAALRATGWDPQRVLHVGDSLHSDVGGAMLAGLRSGWVNRVGRIHDIGRHTPDHEFADLLELRALVERWLEEPRAEA